MEVLPKIFGPDTAKLKQLEIEDGFNKLSSHP